MNTLKPPPRFVPTLTEVVDPTTLTSRKPTPTTDIDHITHVVTAQLRQKTTTLLEHELIQLRAELDLKLSLLHSVVLAQVLDSIPDVVQEAVNSHRTKEAASSSNTGFD